MQGLTEEDLKKHLKHAELELKLLGTTDSTNKRAIEYALAERPTRPVLFIADEQTAGRGRLGRSFISPRGGIYMTLLLPTTEGTDILSLTTYTATVVCEVLEEMTELSPKIKWVNDIYIGERKLSGILAQGAVDAESGRITHVAVGIGLNVEGNDLAPEIADIATTLMREGCALERAELTARITDAYLEGLEAVGTAEATEKYRGRSMLTGCEVNVLRPDRTYTAKVLGIGDGCELIIELPDGSTELLTSGDVSVRKLK